MKWFVVMVWLMNGQPFTMGTMQAAPGLSHAAAAGPFQTKDACEGYLREQGTPDRVVMPGGVYEVRTACAQTGEM